jgi:hypothetical protein
MLLIFKARRKRKSDKEFYALFWDNILWNGVSSCCEWNKLSCVGSARVVWAGCKQFPFCLYSFFLYINESLGELRPKKFIRAREGILESTDILRVANRLWDDSNKYL